jgi:phosphate acetyltransferase
MTFLDSVHARAALKPRRIVFPETTDGRVLSALLELARSGPVQPVAVLDPAAPMSHAAVGGLGVEVVDPERDPRRCEIAARMYARRGSRGDGLTEETADRLASLPLYFAHGLVALDAVDGCVAGAVHTTAEVVRAALRTIGVAPGVRTVSSAFYMIVPPFRSGDADEVLTFADCAVVPEPTPVQLADIATAAALDRAYVVGDLPRVAFLSYSTLGSCTGESVDRVRAAVSILRQRHPTLAVEGELQADAALIPAISARKAPTSAVAGRANVLIFPSLDAGNIGYKLVERLAHARAAGPILQGLARPCSDLSRGTSVDDIINVAAITALRSHRATTEAGGIPRGEES